MKLWFCLLAWWPLLLAGEATEVASDEAYYQGQTLTLVGHVSVHHPMGTLHADRALVECAKKEGMLRPSKISCYDNVRLTYQTEEQYALADQLFYYPDQHLMVLTSTTHPVLFFDKKRELQLSAQEIRAEYDPATHQHHIHGVGEVRFLFKEEELDTLKETFAW